MRNYGNPHEHVLHLRAVPGVGRVLITTTDDRNFEVLASDPVWVYMVYCLPGDASRTPNEPYWMRWEDIAENGIRFRTRKDDD